MPSLRTLFNAVPAVFAALVSLGATPLFAQIAGTNAFLQGQFVETGVNRCGAYGSNALPAPGPLGPYHPSTGLGGLGFVADSDQDGWTTGTPPYCGDYFVPGSPVEGWAVTISASDVDVRTNTDQSCGSFEVPGGITTYTDAGAIRSVVWEGTASWPGGQEVEIVQNTVQVVDKAYFVTQLTFCNTGSVAIPEFYYCRNVDPDNDQPWSGDFTTLNTIVSQPPADEEALVTAEGLTFGCFLGLGSRDPNARVTYGNFFTGNPYQVWNFTGGYSGSGVNTADEAISIAYRIQDFDPGECFCFAFAYILNVDDLAEALDATASVGVLAGGVDISASGEAVLCESDTITLEVLGDDSYTWTWTPSTGLSADTGSVVQAFPSVTTTYTLNGTGSFCGDVERTVTVVVDTDAFADAGDDVFICRGESVVLDGSGGVTNIWAPALGLSATDILNPIASPTTTRTYTLTTFTVNGCDATDQVTINVWDPPVIFAGSGAEICLDDSVRLSAVGGVSYTWTPATGLSSTTGAQVWASPSETTNYIVVGTDANGCSSSAEVEVFVNPKPDVTASADPSTIDIVNDETSVLTALPTGGISYSWTPLEGILTDPNSTSVTVQPQDTTTYFVLVADANGCTNIDSVVVNVIGEYEVYLPTAFSPNSDGINDTYAPFIIGISGDRGLIDYSIYNRWGEQIFVSTDRFAGWDGTYKGQPQPVGSYVVVVRSEVKGESVVHREVFQLVR